MGRPRTSKLDGFGFHGFRVVKSDLTVQIENKLYLGTCGYADAIG